MSMNHATRTGSRGGSIVAARLLAFLLLALPVTSVRTMAQGQGTLEGRVSSRDGSLLASANISLDGGRMRAITQGDGSFKIAGIDAGEHRITISFVGYRSFETKVTIRAGVTERVDIVLDERPTGSSIVVEAPRGPYRVQTSGTALKVSQPLSETPASVQVITAERLRQQSAERVSDVFEYMTGVSQGGGTRAHGYLLRGIAVDDRFIPYQVDGISGGVWRQHEPPAAIIERIEYLKGPSSVLYGITQLGGVINYVTKKPKATPEAFVELRHTSSASPLSGFGDHNSVGVTADVTGPVGSSQDVLYRFIGSQISNTSFRGTEESSLDVMPMVTWNMAEATSLTASLNVNIDRGDWDEYLPIPGRDLAKLPELTTRINEPTDFYWDEGWGVGFTLRHALGASWNIRSTARHTSRDDGRSLFEFSRLLADNQTMARNYRVQANHRNYSYIDVAADGQFSTGPVEHTVLAGGTYGYEDIHFDRRNLQGDSTLNINIYNPVHNGKPLLPAKPGFDRYWDNQYMGLYLQDIVGVTDMIKVVAGMQFINAVTDHEERRSGLLFEKKDAGVSTRAGLVVLPVQGLTVYGSYSTSFSPTNAERENAEGTIDFKPETGSQIEAGVKFDLFDARLGGTVAAYTLDYRDALNRTAEKNKNGNDVYVQTGRSNFKGVEIELYASPIEEIYVSAGFASASTRVEEDLVAARVGSPIPYAPTQSGNFWVSYSPQSGPLDGLTASLGAVHLGERPTDFTGGTTAPFVLPAYTRMDATLAWRIQNMTLGLALTNLGDTRYYVSGGLLRLVPGAPRTIRTTLQMRL